MRWGWGKTLETLMLVLASQPPKGWAVTDLSKVQRPAPGAAPEARAHQKHAHRHARQPAAAVAG